LLQQTKSQTRCYCQTIQKQFCLKIYYLIIWNLEFHLEFLNLLHNLFAHGAPRIARNTIKLGR